MKAILPFLAVAVAVAPWVRAADPGPASPAAPSAGAALPPLTTVSGSKRLPGKFVWADLVTDDVTAAASMIRGTTAALTCQT